MPVDHASTVWPSARSANSRKGALSLPISTVDVVTANEILMPSWTPGCSSTRTVPTMSLWAGVHTGGSSLDTLASGSRSSGGVQSSVTGSNGVTEVIVPVTSAGASGTVALDPSGASVV